MPIRTKDFMIFLLTLAFLLVGSVSWLESGNNIKDQEATLIYGLQESTDQEVVYQATLPDSKPDERSSRLQSLQGKIAQLFASDDLIEAEVETETETAPEPEVELSNTDGEIILCPNYALANISWDSDNLKFVVTEGARVLYRDGSVNTGNDTASSTILQLPINTFKSNVKTCLNNDIVGIALDGSLLRNGEDKIYKIFGKDTLLGYALDGFPIYGLDNDTITDSCGGTTLEGSYRYYLNDSRPGLIGCFSGFPVSL